MNYSELILDAFERDLGARRSTGATDAFFEGESAKHRVEGDQVKADGLPLEVLAFCVKSIFGAGRASVANTTWRGYRMTCKKIHHGGEIGDSLAVRLNLA